jgi:hypothetical protein
VEMDLRRRMIASEQHISCEMYAFKTQTLLSLRICNLQMYEKNKSLYRRNSIYIYIYILNSGNSSKFQFQKILCFITLSCFNIIRIVFINAILEYMDNKIVFRLRLSFVFCKFFTIPLCT